MPSPFAGRTRRDRGILHEVSGKWSARTVGNLCRNKAILGILEYGRRSEGRHRRLGADGPRQVTRSDRVDNKKTKGIVNGSDIRVSTKLNYEAQYSPDAWYQLQAIIDKRGQNQRGIPRSKDPTKYPLSCRVFDLTDNCGWTMIGSTYGQRKVYTCGRYRKSEGAECHHNVVDANALLSFTIADMQSKLAAIGDREVIGEALLDNLRKGSKNESDQEQRIRLITLEQSRLERVKHTLVRRITQEGDDDEVYPILKGELSKVLKEITQNEKRLTELQSKIVSYSSAVTPEQEVEDALSLIDIFTEVLDNAEATARVQKLLLALGIYIGLNFGDDLKGNREVRKLLGGMITKSYQELSVPIFGNNNRENSEVSPMSSSLNSDSPINPLVGDKGLTELSVRNQRQGMSLRKVNSDGA